MFPANRNQMTINKIIMPALLLMLSLTSCAEKQTASNNDQTNNEVTVNFAADSSGYNRQATFASGCFWCVEGIYESVKGVREVVSGYAGGKTKNPTYESIGTGTTGHAEAVTVYYDSSLIDYPTLLKIYFASQDPTQVNGQGPDKGTQYRSIIFYRNDTEQQLAKSYINELNASGKYSAPVAAEVVSFTVFYEAEGYHQNYVELNPGNSYVQYESIPRIKKFQKLFPELLKPERSLLK